MKNNLDMKTVLIGGAVIGVLFFGNKLLKAIGIFKSEESKAIDEYAASSGNFWSPSWYKTNSNNIMTRASADVLARTIWDSIGMFNDNEEKVKGVFKSLKSQGQVSYLAEVFFLIYNEDLLTFIRGGYWPYDALSDADVFEITRYLQTLPK